MTIFAERLAAARVDYQKPAGYVAVRKTTRPLGVGQLVPFLWNTSGIDAEDVRIQNPLGHHTKGSRQSMWPLVVIWA